MEVLIRLKSGITIKYNDVLRVDRDAEYLYVYEGVYGIKLYQNIIPFKDIETYHIKIPK